MDGPNSTIRDDFDRISQLPEPTWNQNLHYHDFMLSQLPAESAIALDLGCGTGRFTCRLAERCRRVVAIDFSREMIRQALARSENHRNIDYCVADVRDFALPREHFDFVQSLTTLHHLPLRETLLAIKASLKPGGTLAVLDLPEWRTPANYLIACFALPVLLSLRFRHDGSIREDRQARLAWAAHAQHDSFLRLREIREICRSVLPGAKIRRHLLWRYSIVWHKRDAA